MKASAAALLLLLTSAAASGLPVPAGVGFEQRIGEQLPVGTLLMDGKGMERPLSAYLGGKPAVLIFNYFRCPEMCSLVSSGSIDALRQLQASAGKDYAVVTVSIDPSDTPEMARSREQRDVSRYGRTVGASGWHTLVGRRQSIEALTSAAGFRFVYDPRSGQFAHPSGLIVLTREGRISSYFMGVDFSAKRMAAALRDASANRTGPSVFSLLFVCFQGGTAQGRYGQAIWIALEASVALTVAGLFGGIAWMLRDESRPRAVGSP